MPDGTISQVKKGRKFDQVIEGAREVFMRDGYEGASVDDISKAAGVSKATLYSYFPDKSALFMEVSKTECARQASAALEILDLTCPPREVLTEVATHIACFMCSDFGQQSYRINTAEAVRFPEMGRTFYDTLNASLIAPLTEYFQSAIQRGELEIDDLQLAAYQFQELSKAYYFNRLILQVQSSFDHGELARVIDGAVDMFMARYGVKK